MSLAKHAAAFREVAIHLQIELWPQYSSYLEWPKMIAAYLGKKRKHRLQINMFHPVSEIKHYKNHVLVLFLASLADEAPLGIREGRGDISYRGRYMLIETMI
jgi:hypothetical protein